MTTTAQLYDRLNISIERNEEMTLAQKDFLSLGPDEYVIMPDGSKIPSNAMLVKMLGGQVTSVNGERGDVEISADSLGLGSAAFRPAQDFMPNSKEIIKTVESIEDLMALTGMADGDVVYVRSVGSNYEHTTGEWVVFRGFSSVLESGAKSNESSAENFDSTLAFKHALDFEWVTYPAATSLAYYPKSKNKKIRIPIGRYLITDTLPLTSYLHLDFDDGVVIDFKPESAIPLFAPPIEKMKAAYASGATSWKDMTIFGLQITGSALFRGNMTASSVGHATTAVYAANTHHANFSRFAIEGFGVGLHIARLDTSSWTDTTIGNFYENIVDNISVQDCTTCFINEGNLTTVLGCRMGHETIQTNDPNMGDYIIKNYGAGFVSTSLNIASVWRGTNPKRGHIYETCAGSTYHGLYSEYFDNLFVLDPLSRFGGLHVDMGHIMKYPNDKIFKFIEGYMPSYNPATKLRGGRNLKTDARWIELFSSGIQIMNSNAELLPNYFRFCPQYDFKFGMYGVAYAWSQNIATDFKRWESVESGFLSDNGVRFIATQDTTMFFETKQQQYDAYVCILIRDIIGSYDISNIKLNVMGENEFITVAEVVYDYGNGWKMCAVRDINTNPHQQTSLSIYIPIGSQIEIEHIGAYKGGVPLYPTFASYTPAVNSSTYCYSSGNNLDGGAYQDVYSGGQFGIGDQLNPFIATKNGIVNNDQPIAFQYVSTAGTNRSTIIDGNHALYWGDASISFISPTAFNSSVTASGNNRNFSESVGVGLYVNVNQNDINHPSTLITGRVFSDGKYSTVLEVSESFSVGAATINHKDATKPIFTRI